ncbi:portal protein [Variovorax paradoxus]|uniref:portal protein n=1 Tax=Variovorax paradoxus TaxID=34073 RepID=UPI0009EBB741
MMENLTTRDRVQRRLKALKTERSSWMSHWQEVQQVVLPRAGRFFATEENKGDRRNDILDDTATAALTILGAGMQYGMTSPSRPWMTIETADPDLMESAAVSLWCGQVTRLILRVFAQSNTYRSLHSMYEELGAFGTAAAIVLPDYQSIVHHTTLTIGEYTLGTNAKNEVDSLGRELQMTVGQIVGGYVAKGAPLKEKSGSWDWSRVSPAIKNLWDKHEVDPWVRVQQLIEPRRERDPSKLDKINMAWRNAIIEEGASSDQVLHEGGFKRFPVVAPRWAVTGNDIYGTTCPGMRALGGIKQLQHQHMRKLQGIDYQTDPPILVPSNLKGADADFLPGGITYYDVGGVGAGKVENAFNASINLQHLLLDIQDVRELINNAFYADVFLMMDRMPGIQPRNEREVQERHEEKMLMLGPVVERQQTELLAPLINIAFDSLEEAGLLPDIPEELAEQPLEFRYTSVLAQAQRRAAMSGVDRLIGATASIAAAKQDPSVWDNIDTDKAIQKAGDYEGVDPEILRDAPAIQQMRQARAEAQQQAAAAEQAKQSSETARNLAAAPVAPENALGQLVRGFTIQ